jgi:hypothetical protein
VVQKGGREGDNVSELVGEVTWIPNSDMIDERGQARLVRRREDVDLSPFPPQTGEGLGVGILRVGACPTHLQIASQDKEVV